MAELDFSMLGELVEAVNESNKPQPPAPASENPDRQNYQSFTQLMPQRGDRGTDVSDMQQALVDAGVTSITKVDGAFGINTEKGVQEFQKMRGLPETGVFDEATRSALFTGTTSTPASDEPEEVVTPVEGAEYPASPSLAISYAQSMFPNNPQAAAALAATIQKEGMTSRSENISTYRWQTITNASKDAGFLKPSITSSTKPWARKRTSKLYQLYGGSPVLDAEGNEKPLTRDPTKDELKSIQQTLKDAGHYAGAIDGAFGPASKAALKKWQTSKEMSATGELLPSTLSSLGVDVVLKDHEGNPMVEYAEPTKPTPPSGEKVVDIVYNPYYRSNGYSDAAGDVIKEGANTPGAGTWRGRGPVQITNKSNYEAIAPFVLEKTGVDIMQNPDAVANDDAVSYWATLAHLERTGFGTKGTPKDWIKGINPKAQTLDERVTLYDKLLTSMSAE